MHLYCQYTRNRGIAIQATCKLLQRYTVATELVEMRGTAARIYAKGRSKTAAKLITRRRIDREIIKSNAGFIFLSLREIPTKRRDFSFR